MQIDAPDARKTAFCTPRQRCGIPCLCKNGSITSFSGFPISYERRRQRRKLSLYYMSAVGDFRRDTTVGLLFGGGENFIPRPEWLLGRKNESGEPLPTRKQLSVFYSLSRMVPVPRRSIETRDHTINLVGEAGFEPAKSWTTDLQSAPFGRSGIPPYRLLT